MCGIAGIDLAKVLKTNSGTSIWMRNVQMGSIGCCLAVIASLVKDGDAIAASGFFQVGFCYLFRRSFSAYRDSMRDRAG